MGTTLPLVKCWEFVGTTPNKFEGEKRYISTGALDCDHVNEADVEMVTFASRPSRANLVVATGDIIFAKMASTEKTFVIDEVASEDIYSTGFCAVRADITKILPKCLYYFLASSLFLDQKDKNASGATQKAITNAGLAKIIINIPTLDEQRTFVAQMDLLCEAITARREQLAKLDELVKSRFVELFGDVKEEDKLINLCNFIDYRGKTPEKAEDGLPFITAKNVKMHHMSFDTQEFISKETYDRVMTRGFPRIGDVVFTTEAPLGNVCRIPYIETEFYIGQRIITMQTEQLEPAYLEYALSSDDFKRKITEKSSGSTVTGIRSKLLEQLTIPVPPKVVQKQFATFVEQTDKSKLAIQESLAELETLKKALMQKYFG